MLTGQFLFSHSLSKVLEWIFGQPERWFHIQELIRLTALASASLQREIKRLDDSGLLVEERLGNLRRVKANVDSPLYAELSGLIQKTMGIKPTVSKALLPVADQLEVALIFGSVAKGTENATSDVDVLLVSSSLQLSQVLALLLPIELKLGRRIEVKLYSIDEFKARRAESGSVVQRILAGPTAILYGAFN
jgi:predicted nucleotidyltransferase